MAADDHIPAVDDVVDRADRRHRPHREHDPAQRHRAQQAQRLLTAQLHEPPLTTHRPPPFRPAPRRDPARRHCTGPKNPRTRSSVLRRSGEQEPKSRPAGPDGPTAPSRWAPLPPTQSAKGPGKAPGVAEEADAWPKLERFYGDHIIGTVTSGPTYMPFAEIASTLYRDAQRLIDCRDAGSSAWTNNATMPTATAVWVQRATNAGFAAGLADAPWGRQPVPTPTRSRRPDRPPGRATRRARRHPRPDHRRAPRATRHHRAAVLTPLGLAVCLLGAGMLVHGALDRWRLAAWDAEWSVTGPHWTSRR